MSLVSQYVLYPSPLVEEVHPGCSSASENGGRLQVQVLVKHLVLQQHQQHEEE